MARASEENRTPTFRLRGGRSRQSSYTGRHGRVGAAGRVTRYEVAITQRLRPVWSGSRDLHPYGEVGSLGCYCYIRAAKMEPLAPGADGGDRTRDSGMAYRRVTTTLRPQMTPTRTSIDWCKDCTV